jgi:hypothetical protein
MEFAREQSIALEDVPRLVLEATDMARVPHFVARLKLDDSLTSAAREAVAILASDSSATQRALDTAKAAAVRGRTHPPGTCVILLKSVDATRMDAPLATQDVRAERMGVAAMRDPDGPETFHVVLVVQAGPKRGLTCE